MKLLRLLPHLIASFCILLLASCFESHEEVWLNADASGAARFKISLPLTPTKLQGGEEGIREKITEYIETSGAFSSYELNTSVVDDRLYIELYVTFENALDLQKASSPEALKDVPSASTALMGTTDVSFQGLNIACTRTIDICKAIPAAKYFTKKSIRDFKLTTIIHLPKAPISHNATSTENEGKTLIWITPLEKAIAGPQQSIFVMPIPIPWVTVSVLASVLLLLIVLLTYYIISRRKRKQTA